MTVYQFAILRYMHNALSGEFANVGVVMWIPSEQILLHQLSTRYKRLSDFFAGDEFNGTAYRCLLRSVQARLDVCREELRRKKDDLPYERAPEEITDILQNLLPRGDSALYWSQPMGGVAEVPAARLGELVDELIERYAPEGRKRRDEAEIWTSIEQSLQEHGLFREGGVRRDVDVASPLYHYRFRSAWNNGVLQVLEPVSLDYLTPGEILEKANSWSGRLLTLGHSGKEFKFSAVVSAPRDDLRDSMAKAMAILRKAPNVRQVVTEGETETLIAAIEEDLRSHGGE